MIKINLTGSTSFVDKNASFLFNNDPLSTTKSLNSFSRALVVFKSLALIFNSEN